MKTTLERRILLFSFVALFLTIAVNTGFNVESFHSSYRDGVLRRCETLAQSLRRPIENIINLGLPLGEIEGLSERCNTVVQNDPEIAYCLIEDAKGTILYHSNEPYPKTTEVTFAGRLSPDVSILDDPKSGRLYDYSLPIYDFEDQVTGRIRIGFQKEILDELTVDHFLSSLLVLGGAFVVVFALIVLFARSSLVKPIKRLCNMASEISSGNFQVEPPDLKTSELSTLGDSLKEMANSLHERDQQIRSSYKELEETNLELQKSYENLESLSSELGRSREMYRSLLDDASDAILVCNEGDDLMLVNKAAERFFGMSRELIEGRNYFSFLESIRCRDIEQHFDRHHRVTPGHSINSEIRFWRVRDQRQLLGWATSCAIVDKDGKRFVQVIVRDATNEEEIRLNLQKTADEMARLNQMKNSFLGLASHELKTPLTIIMGYVELLMTEMADRLDKGTLEMIEHISRASNRLSEIIRDMVDVSLLDNQTIELASKPTMINTLIEQAVENSRPHIEERKQYLHLGLADDLPPIRCDVDRMIQVLNNIISNAIKFTPDSGHITIQTRHVRRPRIPAKFASNGQAGACLLSGEKFSYIEVSVADTGIGIAEDDQEAIFDKFYEVGEVEEHSTGKVAFKSRGAGLGLTVVKGIVALHGGAVWAESPGYDPETFPGSTFYVLLPVQEGAKPEIAPYASV